MTELKPVKFDRHIRSHHPKSIIYWVTEGIVIDNVKYSISEFVLKDDGLFAIVTSDDRKYYEVFLSKCDNSKIENEIKELNNKLSSLTNYDDYEIKQRINDLELQEDKDTVYTPGNNIDIDSNNSISISSTFLSDNIIIKNADDLVNFDTHQDGAYELNFNDLQEKVKPYVGQNPIVVNDKNIILNYNDDDFLINKDDKLTINSDWLFNHIKTNNEDMISVKKVGQNTYLDLSGIKKSIQKYTNSGYYQTYYKHHIVGQQNIESVKFFTNIPIKDYGLLNVIHTSGGSVFIILDEIMLNKEQHTPTGQYVTISEIEGNYTFEISNVFGTDLYLVLNTYRSKPVDTPMETISADYTFIVDEE